MLPYDFIKFETSNSYFEKQMQLAEENENCPFFTQNGKFGVQRYFLHISIILGLLKILKYSFYLESCVYNNTGEKKKILPAK